jgi:hypothetical protein
MQTAQRRRKTKKSSPQVGPSSLSYSRMSSLLLFSLPGFGKNQF